MNEEKVFRASFVASAKSDSQISRDNAIVVSFELFRSITKKERRRLID